MKNKLKISNLSIGILTLILFAVTGQLMRHYYHNAESPEVERLFRRSRHIYILFSGLVQGGIGLYIKEHSLKTALVLQWLATILMSTSAGLLAFSFFYEIPDQMAPTPVARLGIIILLISAGLHLVSSIYSQFFSLKK